MKTRLQPLEQTRFGMAQVRIGDADLLKSEFATPCAYLLREFGKARGGR